MKQLSFFFIVFLMVSLVLTSSVTTEVKAQEGEKGSFGNPVIPTPLNWTRFWKLFNKHSAWDLEYNNGSGWISDKSAMQVIKNYSRIGYEGREYNLNKSDASACKITLNFTAPYLADYRLTFGIDLDVKNYTHKEGSWNYTITYQNHTVFFDWSDIKDLPLDYVGHGIKPVGEESWFWFRIRKNNVPQGYNVVIDPSFGNTNEETTEQGCVNYQSYQNFTFVESQSGTYEADSISVFYDVNIIDVNMSFALYNNTWNLIQYCEEEVNATVQDDVWITLDFLTPKPQLENDTHYILSWWQSGTAPATNVEFHRTTQPAPFRHAYFNNPYDYPNWDDPATHNDNNLLASIFCNYTVAGGQTYTENPSINLVFSIGSSTTFYGHYTWNPSINLVFGLASSLQHITALWNVNPAINLVFALSSATQTYRTFIQTHSINLIFSLASTLQKTTFGLYNVNPSIILDFALSSLTTAYRTFKESHSINLIFSIASTVQHITGQIFNVNPSVIINFALSITSTFIQHYWKVNPSIILDFVLSSTTNLIQHLFHVSASIDLIFQMSSFLPLAIIPVEISTSPLGLAIVAIAIALCALVFATKKRNKVKYEHM